MRFPIQAERHRALPRIITAKTVTHCNTDETKTCSTLTDKSLACLVTVAMHLVHTRMVGCISHCEKETCDILCQHCSWFS